jgi:hypothetical protein
MKRKPSKRKPIQSGKPQPVVKILDAHGGKPGRCVCGCRAEVRPGHRFKQGHDARMRPNSQWRKQHPELGR